LINQERTSRGLSTLTLHRLLAQAAKDYSREMMEHQFINHVSEVDGSTPMVRIRRTGYYDNYYGPIVVAENIALLSGSARATSAHQGFMGSEGHRANLLASDVNEIGIGITEGTYLSMFASIYVEVFAYHARDQQITLSASINPGTAAVRRGEKAAFTIRVESTSPTNVLLQVANMPANLAWSFDKTSGMTPLDAVLTVDTSTASTGIYPFNIVVTGSGQTKVLSPSLTISGTTQTATIPLTTSTTTTRSTTSTTTSLPTTSAQTSRSSTTTSRTSSTLSSSTHPTSTTATQTLSSTTSSAMTTSTTVQTTQSSNASRTTQTNATTTSSTLSLSTSRTTETRAGQITIPIPTRCLVAAAAFGSWLAKDVQELRELRDGKIMSTFGGRMFMTAFHAGYYSLSPPVASYVLQESLAASAVRILVLPLITILRVSVLPFGHVPFDEVAVLLCGLLASVLISLTYVFPPLILIGVFREFARKRS